MTEDLQAAIGAEISRRARMAAAARWERPRAAKAQWIEDALLVLIDQVKHRPEPDWRHPDYLAALQRSSPPFCYMRRWGHWEALRRAFIEALEELEMGHLIKRH